MHDYVMFYGGLNNILKEVFDLFLSTGSEITGHVLTVVGLGRSWNKYL